MDRKNIAVVDVETGGFDCTQCAITQIAIVGINTIDFSELVSYQSYIQPYDMRYDKQALDYTNTTISKLEKEGKPIDIVAKEVVNVLEQINTAAKYKNRHRPIIAGHNVRFDVGFIQTLLAGCGYKMEDYFHGGKDAWGNFQPSGLDTWDLSIMKYGDDEEKKKFNLETVCDYEGVEIVDAHNALNDTKATGKILTKYLGILRNGGGGQGHIKENIVKTRHSFQI